MYDTNFFSTETITVPIGFRLFVISIVNNRKKYSAKRGRGLRSLCVKLYSLSTSLALLCSLKTQDYVLLLSTYIIEYDVLFLWLSPSLSFTPCAHRLNTAHFTDTPSFLLIIYHTGPIIHEYMCIYNATCVFSNDTVFFSLLLDLPVITLSFIGIWARFDSSIR